jgi:hypothetical protein
MFNHLRDMIKENVFTPQATASKNQPADALTKPTGALENLRSLSMLQGRQPEIEVLFDRYSQRRRNSTRPSQSSQMVAAAIASDGYARLPYDLLEDDSDDIDANIQVAVINGFKHESDIINSPAYRQQYIRHLNRWAHYQHSQPQTQPFTFTKPIRQLNLQVTINLTINTITTFS